MARHHLGAAQTRAKTRQTRPPTASNAIDVVGVIKCAARECADRWGNPHRRRMRADHVQIPNPIACRCGRKAGGRPLKLRTSQIRRLRSSDHEFRSMPRCRKRCPNHARRRDSLKAENRPARRTPLAAHRANGRIAVARVSCRGADQHENVAATRDLPAPQNRCRDARALNTGPDWPASMERAIGGEIGESSDRNRLFLFSAAVGG